MGTCNFAHPQNASEYFVVGANIEESYSECECGRHYEYEEEFVGDDVCPECEGDVTHDTETRALEVWQWEELKSNLTESLGNLDGFIAEESRNNRRSYNSTFLGKLEESKAWGDAEFHVVLKPCITSAYYEGATLDFKIEITTYSDTFDYNDEDIDTILDDGFDEYYIELNRGLVTRFRPYAKAWIEKTVERLSEELETVFKSYAEHQLQRQGVMSNGVAVYTETA
jgi:hypothetical protein